MQCERINSIKDPRVLRARTLQTRKGRADFGGALAEGWEQIRWALDSHCRLEFILMHDRLSMEDLAQELPGVQVPVSLCSEGILKKVTGTKYLLPVVAVVQLPQAGGRANQDLKVVFDGVQDFGNIGTIVRTAAAFGIRDFVATQPDFDLFQRRSVDASRGTVFGAQQVNYSDPAEMLNQLKGQGYQVVATALEGSRLQSLAQLERSPVALVFGNETNGVSDEVLEQADLLVQIPMATQLDSLNVGVAAGISLYELKLKMVIMMLNDKIRGSLGRNLSATSKWLRRLFDTKLKAVCDLSADQAVVLMILACDDWGEERALLGMAGIDSSHRAELFPPLLGSGYLASRDEGGVILTEKGRELLGKIWNVQESVENLALAGFTSGEREQFRALMGRIQDNLGKEISFD